MQGIQFIPVSFIWLVLIATTHLLNAASAVPNADEGEVGNGVHSQAKIPCAAINSECGGNIQCCSFKCVRGYCWCVAKGEWCTIDTDCCKFKSRAFCNGRTCSA